MANHHSAIKKQKHDEKMRMINRMNISKMRNKIKLLKKRMAAGEKETATPLFREVVGLIDKTSSKGTIHPRTASRYKSRITNLANKSGIEI